MALHVDQFTWHKAKKTLTAEVSDLWGNEMSDRLIVEGHTRSLSFEHVYTDRDADQDITYWEYRNGETGIIIKIWND